MSLRLATVALVVLVLCAGCISEQTVRNVSQYIAWDYVAMSALDGLSTSRLAQKYMPAAFRGGGARLGAAEIDSALNRMDGDLANQSDSWSSGPARICYDDDLKSISHRRVLRSEQVALMVSTGQIKEGEDALLRPTTPDRPLPTSFQQTMDDENADRRSMLAVLANQIQSEAVRCGEPLARSEAEAIVGKAWTDSARASAQ